MADEKSDWNSIGIALKSLLSKYDLNLSGVGTAQRLAYSDFETIFYHLFMMIDPSDCRRKFWSLYPARNQEEKSRFIEEATIFINNKHLSSQRVTSSQLRMCGGEPFRRLLIALMKKASELELISIDKKLNLPDFKNELSISELLGDLARAKETTTEKLVDLKNLVSRYNHLQATYSEKNDNIDHLWSILTCGDKSDPPLTDNQPVKEIYKSILDQLESNDIRRKNALQKIKQFPEPKETTKDLNCSLSKHQASVRMSYLFKEIRQHLTLSPENPQVELKSKMSTNVVEQLSYYDHGVENLISIWEEERDKAYDTLLASSEMQDRYKLHKNLIPLVEFETITIGYDPPVDDTQVFDEVFEVLKEYKDPRYDDEEILKVLISLFNKNK